MYEYRKKPVVIEAIEFDWTMTMLEDLRAEGMEILSCDGHTGKDEVYTLKIGTLEGGHIVSKGDFIIKGIKGEFYPCKPEIFKLTYDQI